MRSESETEEVITIDPLTELRIVEGRQFSTIPLVSYRIKVLKIITQSYSFVSVGDMKDIEYTGLHQLPQIGSEIIFQIGESKYIGKVVRHYEVRDGFYREQGLIDG